MKHASMDQFLPAKEPEAFVPEPEPDFTPPAIQPYPPPVREIPNTPARFKVKRVPYTGPMTSYARDYSPVPVREIPATIPMTIPEPSLTEFRDFCAAQPADMTYYYLDTRGCPMAMFASSIGIDRWVGKTQTRDGFWPTANRLAAGLPSTYGALTARINQYLPN